MRKLPRYVHGYIDVRGKSRFYLRRPGAKKLPLPGMPYSEEFMTAYAAGMKQTENPVAVIGADRIVPRSLRALAIAYYASAAFKALKPITQGVYRNIIDAFCKTLDANGQPYADKPAGDVGKGTIGRPQIEALMQMRADKPDSANGLRKVMREMMKVAVSLGWRKDDPTQGVKKIKPKKKGGFHRWTDAEIATFEKRHPVGSKARLAMALGLFTGQARQDVIAMGAQHIGTAYDEEGAAYEVLNWVRLKTEDSTGLELAIPVHPDLRAVIDATPSGHMNFLMTEFNKPFTAAGFGGWFRDRCDEAGLPQCSFHGLRKASATRLIDMGCDVVEAASITGHATLKELQRYIEERDRKKAARRAMSKLISGTKLANSKIRLATSTEKA